MDASFLPQDQTRSGINFHSPSTANTTTNMDLNSSMNSFPNNDFGIPGMDFLDTGEGFNTDQSTTDFGVNGLGFDFNQHDWNENGNQTDLFDGFWFGNA